MTDKTRTPVDKQVCCIGAVWTGGLADTSRTLRVALGHTFTCPLI